MRKILVTAISGNVANGILKELTELKEKEDELYGCDVYDYPVGMDKVKLLWKSDFASSPAYIENLLAKCKQLGITHIIPANEKEIEKINLNRKAFEKNNIHLIMCSDEILNCCFDKYETVKYLNKFNIDVPKTYLKEDFLPDGNNYIVKLRHSCGSKFLKIIKSLDELTEEEKKQDIICQQYIPDENNEYTVGVFCDGNITNSIIFKRKLEHGYTSFVELTEDNNIALLAKKIAEIFSLKGSLNIQLRKYQGKFYIFEINPRISGTVYFRHLLGFSDAYWWLCISDGKTIPEYVQKYHKAVGVRELNEKYLILDKKFNE